MIRPWLVESSAIFPTSKVSLDPARTVTVPVLPRSKWPPTINSPPSMLRVPPSSIEFPIRACPGPLLFSISSPEIVPLILLAWAPLPVTSRIKVSFPSPNSTLPATNPRLFTVNMSLPPKNFTLPDMTPPRNVKILFRAWRSYSMSPLIVLLKTLT